MTEGLASHPEAFSGSFQAVSLPVSTNYFVDSKLMSCPYYSAHLDVRSLAAASLLISVGFSNQRLTISQQPSLLALLLAFDQG